LETRKDLSALFVRTVNDSLYEGTVWQKGPCSSRKKLSAPEAVCANLSLKTGRHLGINDRFCRQHFQVKQAPFQFSWRIMVMVRIGGTTLQSHINRLPPEVLLYGGTGQAKILRTIVEHYGSSVAAVIDDTPGLLSPFPDVPIYEAWEGFKHWARGRHLKKTGFLVAIGNPHGRARLRLHEALVAEGLQAVTVAHPTAWIDKNVEVGTGSQILAGAMVLSESVLGKQCIVNTNASVDHENVLEGGVEIGPGATLCGLVKVGVNGWVCAGATVLPRISIGADAVIGAGAVVTKNVAAGETLVGVPARPTEENCRRA
jgi:sugar O-acyltransferase (sialic acid O-acetyltransferase NeuD family)